MTSTRHLFIGQRSILHKSNEMDTAMWLRNMTVESRRVKTFGLPTLLVEFCGQLVV